MEVVLPPPANSVESSESETENEFKQWQKKKSKNLILITQKLRAIKRAWRHEDFDEDMMITHADDNADDLTANIDNVEDCNNDSDDSDSS